MDRLELYRDKPILLSDKKEKKDKKKQKKRSSSSGEGQSQPRQQSPQRPIQEGSGGASPSGQSYRTKENQRSGGQGSSQGRNENRTNQSSPNSSGQPKRSYPLSSPYKKKNPANSESKPTRPGQKQINQNDKLKSDDAKLRTAPGNQDDRKGTTTKNQYTNNKNATVNKSVNVKKKVDVKNKTNVYVRNKNVINVKRRLGPVAIRRGSWSRRGWVVARPWRYGWYGGWRPAAVVYPGWGWWAATAPTWGAITLSPTIIIQQSVDSAVASNTRYIDVPNSDFRIYHASISPVGPDEIEFDFQIDGDSYRAKADCKNGLLNDETPSALDEAELMHGACTIAFSSLNDDQASAPSLSLTAISLSPRPLNSDS